jgi:hypothetical protein
VLRVFPTCEVVGSFRVRGRAGVNRIPFRGRLRGRPLSSGTYRLLIAARGARPVEATVVVARGKVSAAKLRKARRANVCVPVFGFDWTASYTPSSGASGGNDETGVATPIVGAAKGIVQKGNPFAAARAPHAGSDSGPLSTESLFAIGLLMLALAGLSALFLVNVVRWRERLFR